MVRELTDVPESTNLAGSQESQPSGSFNAAAEDLPFGAPPAGGEAAESGAGSEGAPADANAGELAKSHQRAADLDAKLTRSRQEVANYKQRLVDLNPYIELGLKAQTDPQLRAQLQAAAAADPNAPGPAAAVAAAQGQQQTGPNQQQAFIEGVRQVVREEVANTWDQKNFDSRQMDRLNKRASAELEGYEKMAEHPMFIDLVNQAIYLQSQRGTLEQKDDDPTYSAMQYAHQWFLASNADYMKAVKETGKKEALDKAENKAVAEAAGGKSKSAEIGGEERPATTEEKDMVNILKAFRGGRRRLPSAQR